MKKLFTLILALGIGVPFLMAQEDEAKEPLSISGSVDLYYKYDFSGYSDADGVSNIPTSFADEQNSLSIGMLDIALSQTVGKASFVGEFSFGPRSFKSIPTFDLGDGDEININIQNLYVSYAVSDAISFTAGYMGTFVGYEVISPTGNFNYSTSYLFTNGPFQNAGLKMDWSVSDNFGLMVGVFNDWNVYQDFDGLTDIGAQLYFAPTDGFDIYLNVLNGGNTGFIVDLTTGYQMTDKFYLGLNAADFTFDDDDDGGYTGFALYPQFALSDAFSLGYRGEYFIFKEVDEGGGAVIDSENVFSSTLTGNFYSGPLTLSTEVRFDSASADFFSDSDFAPTDGAAQFLIAAIYAF